ncbi:MAG: tetratricopeptide repeat protein [Isosphaerales bacterium]
MLLYELLTGQTPLEPRRLREAAFTEVLRRIREEEPPRPSMRLSTTQESASIAASRGTEPARLARLVRGDLDWIVMKALEKDPARRYETASSLARDVRRHLEGDPVEAGPPTAMYRLRKLARKHRTVLGMATAIAAVLVAATAISAWQAVRATRAERLARVNLAKAQEEEANAEQSASESAAVVDFFRDKILAAARPAGHDGGLGRGVTLRDALDHAESSISGSFADQPTVEARIRDALGQSYGYFHESDLAIRQHERARVLFEATLGPAHHSTLVSMSGIAEAHLYAGRLNEAIPLFEETLKLMRAKLAPNHPNLLNCIGSLALDYQDAGRIADAIALHEESLRLKEVNPGPEHPDTLRTRNNLARAYQVAGRIAEAIRLQEETLKLAKVKMGPDHPHTLIFMKNLAEMYLDASRWADAETTARECLKLREEKKPDDWLRFHTMSQLGAALAGQKKYDEAEPLLVGGYEGMKAREAKIPAPSTKALAAAAARIVPFYEAWGKADKAAAWRKKLGQS